MLWDLETGLLSTSAPMPESEEVDLALVTAWLGSRGWLGIAGGGLLGGKSEGSIGANFALEFALGS